VLNLDRLNAGMTHSPMGSSITWKALPCFRPRAVSFSRAAAFRNDLEALAFAGAPQALKDKYVFHQLYDTIKAVAQTFANVDRYVLSGSARDSPRPIFLWEPSTCRLVLSS